MKTIINFIATGDENAALCQYAVDSLMLQGYTGHVRVYTDRQIGFRYSVPEIVQVTAGQSVEAAKKLKVESMQPESTEGFDIVCLCDTDILFSGPINRIIRRAADGKIHASHATSRNLVTCLLKHIWTPEQMQQFQGWPMIDTYFLCIRRNEANDALLRQWKATFGPTAEAIGYTSDAHAFNRALIDTGRYNDVVVIPEAERLNGRPKPTTKIHHFIYGQHVRMPALFRVYAEEPFLSGVI